MKTRAKTKFKKNKEKKIEPNLLERLEKENESLNLNQYKTIDIKSDGNCAYRCISFYYQNNQENYHFRDK